MLSLLSLSVGLSASRTPSMGDNAPAMRPRQTPVRTPVTAARPAVAAVVPTSEDAAKAAWLAKQDAFGGLAGVHFMLQKSGRHEIAWRSDQLAHLLDSGWHG